MFPTLQALVDSDLYKRVVDGETRLNRLGTKRVKRTAACRNATVREYEQLLRDGVQIPPQLHFRKWPSALWAVTRTFGTGWTFRATALTYDDAIRLYEECVNVRSIAEVIGDTQPTPTGSKHPFSRRALLRSADRQEPQGEEDEDVEVVEVESVEVEAGIVDDEDDHDDHDEDDELAEVHDATLRSGRVTKRPNLYIREDPAQPQQAKRPKAAVVTAPDPSTDAPIARYDDAEEMRFLKNIREQIAHLL